MFNWKRIGWAVAVGVGLIIGLGFAMRFGLVTPNNQMLIGLIVLLTYIVVGGFGSWGQNRPFVAGIVAGGLLALLNILTALLLGYRFHFLIVLFLLGNVAILSILGGGVTWLLGKYKR